MPNVGERRNRSDGKAYAEWTGQVWVEHPIGAPAKPGKAPVMPSGVVNKLNDEIDAIGTATDLNARMEPYRRELKDSEINLGPIRNIFMEGQNFIGASTPASRRYGTFRSDLEKMRNDSLRLNKGVQTEGDAQRAWNELFKNLNDEQLVADRLAQIQAYNETAVNQKRSVVRQTRQQYGMGEPDYSGIAVPRDRYVKPSAGKGGWSIKPVGR